MPPPPPSPPPPLLCDSTFFPACAPGPNSGFYCSFRCSSYSYSGYTCQQLHDAGVHTQPTIPFSSVVEMCGGCSSFDSGCRPCAGPLPICTTSVSNSGRRLAANQTKSKTAETAKPESAPVVVKTTSAAKTEPLAAAFDIIGRSLVGGTVARAYSDDDVARLLITQHGRSMQSSSNTQYCDLFDMNTGSCGGLAKKTSCWVDGYSSLLGDVCCASSTSDCCEVNPGALAGVIIGGVVVLALLIASCVACCISQCCACCPCNKHNPKKLAAAGATTTGTGDVQIVSNDEKA